VANALRAGGVAAVGSTQDARKLVPSAGTGRR